MERKKNYVSQLLNHTESYKKIIIAECSNVGSNQLQSVRTSLRGKAIILMGKNSLMRKGLKTVPKLAGLVSKVKGNVCLIFTNSDLKEVRDIINSNKRPAAVKAGQISAKKVIIPAQNTGMEPTKTSFFQALNIPTKIQKGTVEIVSDSTILEPGQKVSASQAALLQLLNMKPFEYGLIAQHIYDDGVIYSPDVLDTSAEDMSKLLNEALTNITGISVETGYPTALSVSSLLLKGFQETVAISLGTNYDFGETAKFKEALKNPTKFAPKVEEKKVEKKEEKKEEKKPAKVEEKEPSDADMGLGLFGDD